MILTDNAAAVSGADPNTSERQPQQNECCGHCGAYPYPGDRFCARCGNILGNRCCGGCGARIEHPVAYFCTQCGTSFERCEGHGED